MKSTTQKPIDGLFISYYEDIDRWGNDHAPSRSGPTGSPAFRTSENSAGKDNLINRMGRQSVGINGSNHDLARFYSRARFGTNMEYRRYDAYTPTHLSGSYYESLAARHGYSIYHANHVTRVDLERLAPQIAPRFLFLSTTYLTEAASIIDASQHLRAQWPGVPLIMGGLVLVELSRSLPPKVFEGMLRAWGADAYVITPLGEAAFLKLLESAGEDLESIDMPMAWVRRGSKFIQKPHLAEPGLDMDTNYVRWSQLDPSKIYHTVHTRTARSCAFVCSFCSYFSNQGPLTLSAPKTLEAELEELASLGTVKNIIFTDDTFNVPQARFKELLKVLQKYDFGWWSYYRAQFADEDTAKQMVDSGCKGVFMGIESINDKVLKNMQKAATRKVYTRGIRELKKAGLITHANFMLGFPGDVPGNTNDLVDWVDSEGVDFFTVTPWYCSPATPIGTPEGKQKFGIVGNYWRWKHDTMDSKQALDLEIWAIENAKSATFTTELAGQSYWSQIMLLVNDFTVAEAKRITEIFNGLAGDNHSMEALLKDPNFLEARRILRSRPTPAPPGSELYRTEAELENMLDRHRDVTKTTP